LLPLGLEKLLGRDLLMLAQGLVIQPQRLVQNQVRTAGFEQEKSVLAHWVLLGAENWWELLKNLGI